MYYKNYQLPITIIDNLNGFIQNVKCNIIVFNWSIW